jgi:hypothetical protein
MTEALDIQPQAIPAISGQSWHVALSDHKAKTQLPRGGNGKTMLAFFLRVRQITQPNMSFGVIVEGLSGGGGPSG